MFFTYQNSQSKKLKFNCQFLIFIKKKWVKGRKNLFCLCEVITANNKKINFEIGPRRDGDVEEIFSDNSKVEKLLNWKAEITLETAMKDAWNWELNK